MKNPLSAAAFPFRGPETSVTFYPVYSYCFRKAGKGATGKTGDLISFRMPDYQAGTARVKHF